MKTLDAPLLDCLMDPLADILTPEVARRLVRYRLDTRAQARLDKLARKCNEGQLSDQERRQYETYVQTIDFIAILQAKAWCSPQTLRRGLMPLPLRQLVRARAGQRCEYCHLPDVAAPASTFHVEHVVARQHAGANGPENRAWSCHRCNLHKGPNLSGRDPLTDRIVRLFDPRRQRWDRHFEWSGAYLVGRTQTGRATIAVLDMNDPQRIELRQALMDDDDWPE